MNALGKLLSVFVFLGALVWLGFTAALFATRSNWQKAAKDAQAESAELEKKANTLTQQVIEERKLNDSTLSAAKQNIIALEKERNAARDEYAKLKDSTDKIASQTQKLQPVIDEQLGVNQNLQAQNNNLTTQVSTLTGARDTAVIARQKAEEKANDATLALGVTTKALEDQIEKTRGLLEARQGAATESDAAFRGDVINVGEGKNQDIIVFTGGSNAGVKTGKRYVVTRSTAPFYIGTVTVIDAANPQFSSGVFTPAAGQKLAGDYIPKKGDTVSSN